ncbi:MAG: ATP synthase F1 subunit delta [Candidatus Portnoybacteria bacterium]|nr:ATP synthase F1 subunit delta [Candidatus Portnoybacteria bacterium]
MRIHPQKYAQALLEILEKDEENAKKLISDFVLTLARNNDLRLAPKIIEKFSQSFDRKNGLAEAEAITAKPVDKETLNKIGEFISKEIDAKKIAVKNRADREILGGIILKYGDKVLDASLKTKLENLKNKMKA